MGSQRAPRTLLKVAGMGAVLVAVAAAAGWFLRRPSTSEPGPDGP